MSIAKILKRLDLNAKLKWPNDIFINDKNSWSDYKYLSRGK